MYVYIGLQSCTHGAKSRSSTAVEDETDQVAVSDEEAYRVLVLGGPGVGKTAIAQQFLTSEYMAAQNTSFGQFHVSYNYGPDSRHDM